MGGLLLAFSACLSLLFGVAYGDFVVGDPPTRPSPSVGSRWNPPELQVHGAAGGLYPGRVKTLRLRIENRAPRRRVVRAIKVGVRDANPGCPARSLQVGSYRRRFVVPPRGRRRVPLAVKMRASAVDACQRAVFPLAFHLKVKR